MATPFEGWAILELLGHRQRPGFVTEVELAGSKMLRVDIPMGPDDAGQDIVLTEYYSGAALYALRPCTEAVARHHVKNYMSDPRPLTPLDFRERPAKTQDVLDWNRDDPHDDGSGDDDDIPV